MPRVSLSNQRTVSLGRRRVVRGPAATAPTPTRDRRGRGPGQGARGVVVCRCCGADVTVKGATFSDPDTGVRIGDTVVSPHRVGGGRYSVMRGDARCAGSDQTP